MMRIGILGNCQARSITQAINRRYPEVEFINFTYSTIDDRNRIEREIDSLDIMVSQIIENSAYGIAVTDDLRPRCKKFLTIPTMTFTGYQPDMAYVKALSSWLKSPAGAYHSKIVVAAFALGLDENRVPDLFNRYIYGRFGYFDEYPKAMQRLGIEMEKTDIFVPAETLAAKPFMHTLNHPNGYAIGVIARQLASVLGLDVENWLIEDDEKADTLAHYTIWPIYPDIADDLGLEGSLDFLPSYMGPSLSDRPVLSIRELVSGSYAAYREEQIDYRPIQPLIDILRDDVRL